MEPITTLVISSAVGGAAGQFVTEIAKNGVTWLTDLISAHSPAMQERAKQNTERFLDRLARRVETLEKEIPGKEEVFEDALSHPSSALLISKALTGAAVTDSDVRHELLSELIAQRLVSGADDMLALAGQAACDVVNSLTTNQIKLLALMVTVMSVRPSTRQKFAGEDQAKEFVKSWWSNNLSPLLDDCDLERVNELDLDHMTALGCLRVSIGSKDLLKLVSNNITENEIKFTDEELGNEKWYLPLKQHFSSKQLLNCTLSSTGSLIGLLRRDSIAKTKTNIDW